MLKRIFISILPILSIFLLACKQSSGSKYQAINRQKAIFLVDQQTGEVFMMDLVVEKGKGVVGSSWKKMGDPTNAR